MNKLYTHLLAFISLIFLSTNFCKAQSGTLALKTPTAAITVDGNSADWGDSLSYSTPKLKFIMPLSTIKPIYT